MKTKTSIRYYTHSHNIEGCLRNGSYLKKCNDGALVQFMNGDCMGIVSAVPASMTEVSAALAKDLLPSCCK